MKNLPPNMDRSIWVPCTYTNSQFTTTRLYLEYCFSSHFALSVPMKHAQHSSSAPA
jgi:hypothetical protein